MRQLRFRVYIPDHGKFTYFDLGNFDYSDRYLHQDKYPVQQWTGLKDSKGIDIYEGDMLQFAYKHHSMKFVGEVTYSNKFACFIVVTENAFETFSDLADYTNHFIVVGNICE
jgi:uncharacterized phage protein (TIGR01671 family)